MDLYSRIDTPAIIIDMNIMERNLKNMVGFAKRNRVKLRPHVKTHKVIEFARMQVELGAEGITVSKVSEAEVMIEGGLDDIFIANQIVTREKIRKLRELSSRATISVGLDSRRGAEALSQVFSSARDPIYYLIEINSGLDRCGVLPGRPALALFNSIKDLPGIRFKGIFTHAGQVYAAGSLSEVQKISRIESQVMAETAELFKRNGIEVMEVSVGSTPTVRTWNRNPSITELRPGNYIFNDNIQLSLGVAREEECALRVLATVISRPEPTRAIIDAGSKVFGLDKGVHGKETIQRFGRILGKRAFIERLSEEHGILRVDPEEELEIGERIEVIPNHACTVMNLLDRVYGVKDDTYRTYRVAARGKVN